MSEVRLFPRNAGRVLNGMQVAQAISASYHGHPLSVDPVRLDSPAPSVRFAEGRLPDFNITQNLKFVSARMRNVMALAESAAQFVPVQNLNRTPRTRAALYWLLHVRAMASAIDEESSDCEVSRNISPR